LLGAPELMRFEPAVEERERGAGVAFTRRGVARKVAVWVSWARFCAGDLDGRLGVSTLRGAYSPISGAIGFDGDNDFIAACVDLPDHVNPLVEKTIATINAIALAA